MCETSVQKFLLYKTRKQWSVACENWTKLKSLEKFLETLLIIFEEELSMSYKIFEINLERSVAQKIMYRVDVGH